MRSATIPELFKKLAIVPIGPVAESITSFTPCEELLREPGVGTSKQ